MAVNSKNTKAEILAAYKEIEEQNKLLESEIKQVQKQMTVKRSPDLPPKSKSTIVEGSNTDILNTIESLQRIKAGFGGAVSQLSQNLITKATQSEQINLAIANQKLELKNLHQLEKIDESTIDLLIAQYQTDAEKFDREYQQQHQQDKQEIEILKQAWAKEQEAHGRAIAARNESDRKNRQREQEEYQYNLDLERDLDEEKYEQEKQLKQQELAEIRYLLEQQWQQKEAEIAKREHEQAQIAAKVAAFEEQLRNKIKQATEEGKGIGTHQAKIKADLRIREIEGEKQNYQLRIETLEQTIRHQAQRINKLSQQLDGSLQQVQDLAVKAIEGSANRNSFEAIKAIAMEQAKTSPKGK